MKQLVTVFLSMIFLLSFTTAQAQLNCVESGNTQMTVTFQGGGAPFQNGDVVRAETNDGCVGSVTVDRNGNQPVDLIVYGNPNGTSEGEVLGFVWSRSGTETSLSIDQTTGGSQNPPIEFQSGTTVKVTSVGEDAVPVELTEFTFVRNGSEVTLEWQTESETNNAGFHVIRDEVELGFVEGNGTTTEASNYTFMDQDLNPGTFTYRLRQVDYDGSVETYGPIEVHVPTSGLEVSGVYPNPSARPNVEIYGQDVTATVYNVLGQKVRDVITGQTLSGQHDLGSFSNGRYFLKVRSGESIEVRPFTVVE